MNVRMKSRHRIIRAGMTMQEVVDLLSDESTDGATKRSTCPQNYSGKASDKEAELLMCWDATLYGSKDGRSGCPGNSSVFLSL